jgi:hypothetical protein
MAQGNQHGLELPPLVSETVLRMFTTAGCRDPLKYPDLD